MNRRLKTSEQMIQEAYEDILYPIRFIPREEIKQLQKKMADFHRKPHPGYKNGRNAVNSFTP